MYCSKCGVHMSATSRFCSHCDSSSGDVSSQNLNGLMGMLTIVRNRQWFAIKSTMYVVIDNQNTYEIENAKLLNIPLAQGKHVIKFSMSIRNKIISINLKNDMFVHVRFSRVTGSIEVTKGESK